MSSTAQSDDLERSQMRSEGPGPGDNGDALTINFGNDYPGGVRVNGSTRINGDLAVGGNGSGTIQARALVLEIGACASIFVGDAIQALLDKTDELIPRRGFISARHIELSIESSDRPPSAPSPEQPEIPVFTMEDLGQVIFHLRERIIILCTRISSDCFHGWDGRELSLFQSKLGTRRPREEDFSTPVSR